MHIPQLQYFYTALPDGLAGCDGKDMEEGGTTCSLFFKTQTVTLSLKEYWFSFLFALSFLSFILRNRSKIDLVQSSHSNPSEGCKCPQPDPLTLRLVFRRWPPLLFRQQPPAQQKIPIASCLNHIVMCMRIQFKVGQACSYHQQIEYLDLLLIQIFCQTQQIYQQIVR